MKKSIYLFVLFFSALLHGKIIEMQNFHEIMAHVTPETLVILDIDDTLIVPVQMLGNDEWFNHRVKTHQTQGMSTLHALEKAIAEWESVRHITKMQIVEAGSDEIVQALQKQGCHVMGLTTQGHSLARRTIHHLGSNNFNLAHAAPSSDEHFFSMDELGVLYHKGILFTSGKHKGRALFHLCEKIGYTPKRILFVNDKASHLKDIEETAAERQIEFVGLRYGYSDARKATFCPKIAEVQLTNSTFSYILSDEEARIFLESSALKAPNKLMRNQMPSMATEEMFQLK